MGSGLGRSLYIGIKAETKDLSRGLRKSETMLGKFATGLKGMAAIGIAAFAALGAASIKFAGDSVRAALDDEKSMRLLAKQMRNTMKASQGLIDKTEDYISATQRQYGIQDDKLRPSLARLIRSTKDATEAQKWLNLALNISSATGKDLDQVTAALGKTIDGNGTALARLGLGVDANIIKGKDLNKIYGTLAKTFGGFAQGEANTLAGKMAILSTTVDQIKEAFGVKIIGAIEKFIPYVQRVGDILAGNDPDKALSAKVKSLRRGLDGDGVGTDNLAQSIKNVATSFEKLFKTLTGGESATANERLNNIAEAFNNIARAINFLARSYAAIDRFTKSPSYQKTLDYLFGPRDTGFWRSWGYFIQAITGTRAAGGNVNAGGTYLVGESGPEYLTMGKSSGYVTPANRVATGSGSVTYNITLNGIVDAESARRSIERVIQQSSRRSGPVNWSGALG